jgi:hypothetical protein
VSEWSRDKLGRVHACGSGARHITNGKHVTRRTAGRCMRQQHGASGQGVLVSKLRERERMRSTGYWAIQ